MKKKFSQLHLFIVKRIVFTTLIVLLISECTFSQINSEDSLFQEADYYLTIGYYDSAIKTLEKLIKLNPNSAVAYNLLGSAFNIQGKYEKAILMYNKCIELDSTLLPVYENLGNAYIDAGKLDSAIFIHKLLIAKDSLYVGNYINLGDAYMKKQETNKAQECFIKAIDLNYYSTLAHVNLATTYYNQEKYREAIDELFLVRNLDDWYPLLQLKLSYVAKTAEKEFEDWVNNEPTNSESHYYYAFSLWYTDERSDAIDELEEAIELNNKCEKYYLAKAIWHHNEEEYEDAIIECNACLALNPDNWMCHNRIGLSYSFLKNRAEALTHYKRAVEIDPFVLESQLKLGEVYIDNKQYSDAVESLNHAMENMVASGTKNPIVYFDLALAYYYYTDYENAMQNAMISKNMNFAEEDVKQDLERELNQLIKNIQQKRNQK